MDPKIFLTVFCTVFLAELGDKTQLATLLYSARSDGARLTVFLAAAAALVVAAALAVLAGALLGRCLSPQVVRWVAGVGFIAVGAWVLWAG